MNGPLDRIAADLIECGRCDRLVAWRVQVSEERRAAFSDQEYWGRPVPGFGDPDASLAVVGLAPAAHGANRTGRMFTGDRSGDFLFRSLHRAGFASQPDSRSADDGLTLDSCFLTSVVHCAPPGNRPTAAEQARCQDWLVAELSALPRLKVAVALGGVAFSRLLRAGPELGWGEVRPRPPFSHGGEVNPGAGPRILASYHPSQQNTFTGRLTEAMLDDVLFRARAVVEGGEFPLRP